MKKVFAILGLLSVNAFSFGWDANWYTISNVSYFINSASSKLITISVNENIHTFEYDLGATYEGTPNTREDMNVLLSMLLSAEISGMKVKFYSEAITTNQFKFKKIQVVP